MHLHIPNVLTREEVAELRRLLSDSAWSNGRITAGTQSANVKNNEQLDEASYASRAARSLVLQALSRSATLLAAALPKKIFPPLFNRYSGNTNAFGNHIDNAVRTYSATGQNVRTDLSATLFLSAPDSYEGGELMIEHAASTAAPARIKFPAGDMVLYAGTTVHRVLPVTRGARLASFFWIESMVRDRARRELLYELDMSIIALRASHGDTDTAVRLTGTYHNLMRMWAET